MSNLNNSIKELYEDISAEEAMSAAGNLMSFFKILEEVESRTAQTDQCSEPKNENIRSTDWIYQASKRVNRICKLRYRGQFLFSSVAIHRKLGGGGYRLTYPSKGKHTLCHPINKKTSQEIEEAIFCKLKNVMNKVNHHVQILQSSTD